MIAQVFTRLTEYLVPHSCAHLDLVKGLSDQIEFVGFG